MTTVFYFLLGWIALGVTVCAGALYLMVTTPVDADEDLEEVDARVRNSMRGTL